MTEYCISIPKMTEPGFGTRLVGSKIKLKGSTTITVLLIHKTLICANNIILYNYLSYVLMLSRMLNGRETYLEFTISQILAQFILYNEQINTKKYRIEDTSNNEKEHHSNLFCVTPFIFFFDLFFLKKTILNIKSRKTTRTSCGVKSFLILNKRRISSGVFPLIILATALHVTSSKPLISK